MEGAAIKSGVYTSNIELPESTQEQDDIYGITENGWKSLTIDLEKGTFSATSHYYYESENSFYVVTHYTGLDLSLTGTIKVEGGVGHATITGGKYTYKNKNSQSEPEKSVSKQDLHGSFRLVPGAHNIVQVMDFKIEDAIRQVATSFNREKLQLSKK